MRGRCIVPIYEYACEECAYTFELKQSIKDEPVAVCSRCGKSVKRIISAPAIMFKGSGWYVTDYSDKLKPPSAESAPNGEKKESAGAADAGAAAPAAAAGTTPSSNGAPPPSPAPASATPAASSGGSTTPAAKSS
jgi:putative FmdB family regulatory protein